MKKINALLLVLAGVSLLSSCVNTATPSSETESSSIASDASEESAQPTSESSKKKSKWGGEAGEAIIDAFGWDIPFIENDGVLFEAGKDAFKDPYIMLYVEFDGWKDDDNLISDKMAEFANICVRKGYTVDYQTVSYRDENFVIYQYPVYFADIVKSETVGFELQIVEGAKNGKEMMGIYAFTYPIYDENSWPSLMVEKAIGVDVPNPVGEYTYYSELSTFEDDGTPFCYIYAYGMYEEDLQSYVELLQKSAWIVEEDEDEYGLPYYRACDSKRKYMMFFGYDYEDYVGSYFYIYKYPKVIF